MSYKVRKGYVVFGLGDIVYKEGMEIPSNILPEIQKNQKWKIEEISHGEETKEEQKEEREPTSGNGEEKEIGSSYFNRMMKNKEVKKK